VRDGTSGRPVWRPRAEEEEEQDGRYQHRAGKGDGRLREVEGQQVHGYARLSRRLLARTETLERDMAAAASIGLISQPVNG
jgi:hypothetical protein